jgi:hypothetical protein
MPQVFFAMVVLAGCCSVALKDTALAMGPSSASHSVGGGNLHEQLAKILRAKGLPCAAMVDVKPLKVVSDAFWVSCIERLGRPQQVRYLVDAALLTAVRAD